MRLWHLYVAVLVLAVAMAVARDEVGRVALVIFLTALGAVVLGTSSVLMLFRTVGAFGSARSLGAHLEAVAATAGVLAIGGGATLGVIWCGAAVVHAVVR